MKSTNRVQIHTGRVSVYFSLMSLGEAWTHISSLDNMPVGGSLTL